MRSIVLCLLAASQLALAEQPAAAAGFGPGEHIRIGLFAGAEMRIPLGTSRAEAPRASLGIAPLVRSQRFDGESRLRIGEGLQLSLRPRESAKLELAGTRLDRLGAPQDQRAGVSTLGWIAIGVGATVVLLVSAVAICMDDNECNPSE